MATTFVLPGDGLPLDNASTEAVIKLGPGMAPLDDDRIGACKAGLLKHNESSAGDTWWVESNQKRYVAVPGESVLGVVIGKTIDHYKVDIGTAQPALLGIMAFEGASKKNRPNHNIGTLLYCRISLANKDMEAELECVNPTTGKADGYGDLQKGFLIKVSLGLSRRLLDPSNLVLRTLGKSLAFETAVGMNGQVWVNSPQVQTTILICNAIKNSEYLGPKECVSMVKKLIEKL